MKDSKDDETTSYCCISSATERSTSSPFPSQTGHQIRPSSGRCTSLQGCLKANTSPMPTADPPHRQEHDPPPDAFCVETPPRHASILEVAAMFYKLKRWWDVRRPVRRFDRAASTPFQRTLTSFLGLPSPRY